MIVALENANRELLALEDEVKELGISLSIDSVRENVARMEETTQDSEFWNDTEKSTKVLRQIKNGKDKIEAYDNLVSRLEDAIVLADMGIEENDESCVADVECELEFVKKESERQRIEILLSGQYDRNNAIVSFQPGAGGKEAQDWA
ncbi:MAG: PCRF domain-containing protein, partial [Clostridia bacterium]|nr:PCRF domain-containing protein [Clostridia bacterium]